ncbi:MAG: hypothetical protein DID92_2727743581 [Candidatus Nitrotoga sp. SPKER]|nr:MAG: hypothetical protein DID92_2727743581 [Candidatus Nitrotoga sp. SPKER]
MTEKKRKTTAGAPRTEVFAMRFDPKLKYLAEIAARKQRRSMANFVEWAVEQALNNVCLVETKDGSKASVADSATTLWALDDSDRLIKLATNFPELLSYDEQVIWRVICEHSTYNGNMKMSIEFKDTDSGRIDAGLVRDCWPELKAYALGNGTREELNAVILTLTSFI